MRLLIVGAGAIGSLVGNRLARAGHEVTLVGRPSYVVAVRERGLGLEEAGRRVYVKDVRAITHVAEVAAEPFDLIIFTMKAYDTAVAAAQVRPLARQGIPILVLQNGVGSEEIVAQRLGEVSILSAVITLVVETLEAGLVRLSTTRGGIGLAPTAPDHSVNSLAEAFREAGFKVVIYPHYWAMKWSKLLLNILGNASSAILDMFPDLVFAHRYLFALERAAFCEARAVMRALGLQPVSLPGYPVPPLAWGICSLPAWLLQPIFERVIVRSRGGKMPSLYLDIVRGQKSSEVEFLNGAVVRYAQEVGLEVPANYALYTVCMDIVKGEIGWEEYRGRPERLLAAASL
ncbi:MAG: ketopantoate reductase family protein [Anaerolineales bacterium]|nr:MAG: ketopantoate reductase family protein [Anaerolineales bacterium]